LNYTYIKKWGNFILIRESDGNIEKRKDVPVSLYLEDGEGKHKTYDGHGLQRYTFDTIKEASAFIRNEGSGLNLYGAPTFGYEFIHNNYRKATPITADDIHVCNFDIETARDPLMGYSKPEDAENPITSISCHDNRTNIFNVFGTGEYDHKAKGNEVADLKVVYHQASTEQELLLAFVSHWKADYPDVITGWNIDTYDIPYLVNRIVRLFDLSTAKDLSPFRTLMPKEIRYSYDKTNPSYDIIGVSSLDFMSLYKKFTYATPDNYQLNTIAHNELGTKKIDYSDFTGLQDLYERDHQKFIEYNIQDVAIVSNLDNKLKLIDLAMSIAYKTGCNYVDVTSPVKTWDVFMYNVLRDKNIIAPLTIENRWKEEYIGAFVKEPPPGVYNWIVSCDLNALYPHLQMQYNISPESHIAPEHWTPEMEAVIEEYFKTTEEGIENMLNEIVPLEFLKEQGVTVTPNGQFFRIDKEGFIPNILVGLYAERKAVKKEMLRLEQVMEDTGEDHKSTIAMLDAKQMAIKILMNSEYGALANEHFRWFDTRFAEAVTSSGQLSIRWVEKKLNIWLNNLLETKEFTDYVIASDTDSLYLNMEEMIEKHFPTLSTTAKVKVLDKFFDDKVEPEIDRIYTDLKEYVNGFKQAMVMKREVIADRGLWTGKKRYCLNVHNSEGVQYKVPKLKIKGMEAVRSSTPEICREAIKKALALILGSDEDTTQKFIANFKEEFFAAEIEEVSSPRSVNEIDKWEDDYTLHRKGTPIAVRGAILFNHHIKKTKNMVANKVQSGDKIKFIYLKVPNELSSNVVSFPSFMPTDLKEMVAENVDWDLQFEKAFLQPIKTVLEVIGWNHEKTNTLAGFFN